RHLEIHPARVLDQTRHYRRGNIPMSSEISPVDLQNRCFGQEWLDPQIRIENQSGNLLGRGG
ncbi:MAG: hypothetical protein WCA10_21615, partial [Terracidiphilus sp.]